MPKFIMLIGLPGSGKSTYARKMVADQPNWVHLSSDQIAFAKYPAGEAISHADVFQEMFNQTASFLESGLNVIYDATNLASKRRKSFLHRIEKYQIESEAAVFLTSYELLKKRNRQREGRERVPDHIVERYIRAMQFPRLDEGFDKITVISKTIEEAKGKIVKEKIMGQTLSYEDLLSFYNTFEETSSLAEKEEMQSIATDIYNTYSHVRNIIHDTKEQEILIWAVLLYSIGKPYVRKNLPIEEDNFYGYEHVSMYLAYPILKALNFSDLFIYSVLLLIDEHVLAQDLKRGKIKRRIGHKNYELLMILLEALS